MGNGWIPYTVVVGVVGVHRRVIEIACRVIATQGRESHTIHK
jgi:hypothetical protein